MARKLCDLKPGQFVQFEIELPMVDAKVGAIRVIVRVNAQGIQSKAVGSRKWAEFIPWAEAYAGEDCGVEEFPPTSYIFAEPDEAAVQDVEEEEAVEVLNPDQPIMQPEPLPNLGIPKGSLGAPAEGTQP
jgi:hypothetical protein